MVTILAEMVIDLAEMDISLAEKKMHFGRNAQFGRNGMTVSAKKGHFGQC